MTVAALGFQIDTGPVAKAVADLDRLTAATVKAEREAQKVFRVDNAASQYAQRIDISARALRGFEAIAAKTAATAKHVTDQMMRMTAHELRDMDIQAYGAELDALRAKFNPVFAASKLYEAELNDLNRAHKVGAINTAEHGAALTALNARYQAAGAASSAFAGQTRMAQQQMRNLAFQFQDIGTMMAMGQSPFMLLAQQLPQVTMYGGQLTGVMGALKSTLAGLFSPLGLLTTGFVLAGSAAISYFTSADDEAKEAAKLLEDQESLIEAVADRWGEAVPALREYAAAIKGAREAADLQSGSQVVMNSYFDEIRKMMPEVNAELSRFGQIAGGGGWGGDLEQAASGAAAAYDDLHSALQDAAAAISEGTDASEDFRRIQKALTDLTSQQTTSAYQGWADAIADIRDRAGEAVGKLREMSQQMAIAAAHEANLGRFDKTGQRLSQDGTDPLSDMEFLSRFGWENDVFNFPREKKPRRARKTDAERAAERYDDMIRQSQQFIASQRLEQQALFMTEEAANALRYEQELLNQAANDNIKLTPEMKRELEGLAQQMASTEAETTRLQDALKFGKDLVRGFVSDLRSGLEQGKGFWRSFGDAAINALDKIVDKLLNDVIDALFKVNQAGSGMGGGGGILGFLGGLFGGVSPSSSLWRPNTTAGAFFTNGFSSGGWTGNGAASRAAGIVHGQEFVVRAGPAAQYRPALEAINAGRGMPIANSNHANQNVRVEVEVFVNDDGTIGALARSAGRDAAVSVVQANNKARQKHYQNGGQFG